MSIIGSGTGAYVSMKLGRIVGYDIQTLPNEANTRESQPEAPAGGVSARR